MFTMVMTATLPLATTMPVQATASPERLQDTPTTEAERHCAEPPPQELIAIKAPVDLATFDVDSLNRKGVQLLNQLHTHKIRHGRGFVVRCANQANRSTRRSDASGSFTQISDFELEAIERKQGLGPDAALRVTGIAAWEQHRAEKVVRRRIIDLPPLAHWQSLPDSNGIVVHQRIRRTGGLRFRETEPGTSLPGQLDNPANPQSSNPFGSLASSSKNTASSGSLMLTTRITGHPSNVLIEQRLYNSGTLIESIHWHLEL